MPWLMPVLVALPVVIVTALVVLSIRVSRARYAALAARLAARNLRVAPSVMGRLAASGRIGKLDVTLAERVVSEGESNVFFTAVRVVGDFRLPRTLLCRTSDVPLAELGTLGDVPLGPILAGYRAYCADPAYAAQWLGPGPQAALRALGTLHRLTAEGGALAVEVSGQVSEPDAVDQLLGVATNLAGEPALATLALPQTTPQKHRRNVAFGLAVAAPLIAVVVGPLAPLVPPIAGLAAPLVCAEGETLAMHWVATGPGESTGDLWCYAPGGGHHDADFLLAVAVFFDAALVLVVVVGAAIIALRRLATRRRA